MFQERFVGPERILKPPFGEVSHLIHLSNHARFYPIFFSPLHGLPNEGVGFFKGDVFLCALNLAEIERGQVLSKHLQFLRYIEVMRLLHFQDTQHVQGNAFTYP